MNGGMMDRGMMDGMGWMMMAGMGLIAILLIVFLIAGIVFFVRGSRSR